MRIKQRLSNREHGAKEFILWWGVLRSV